MVVPGDYRDPEIAIVAADEFQILLGILRAWRPGAGQRKDEIRPGVGPGAIRDEVGNQAIDVTPALSYSISGRAIDTYAVNAKAALDRSPSLRNALWLNGRRDRSAADAYMIYEYARQEFGGEATAAALAVSQNELKNLTHSANNLAPKDGGRHAGGRVATRWNPHQILTFTVAS